MKSLLLPALTAIIALCGCQPSAPTSAAPGAEKSPVSTSPAPLGTSESPRDLVIEAGDTMKFNVTRIEASPGETLRLTLLNTGRAPKEAMGHNWVLLQPGTDLAAYANAAVRAAKPEYIPAELSASVLAHTRMLGGGSKDSVVFTVPADSTPGTEFPFLCTFPAHFQLGMKGVLVVR